MPDISKTRCWLPGRGSVATGSASIYRVTSFKCLRVSEVEGGRSTGVAGGEIVVSGSTDRSTRLDSKPCPSSISLDRGLPHLGSYIHLLTFQHILPQGAIVIWMLVLH